MGIKINGQDFNGSFDDIINAAREFGERIKEMAPELGPMFDSCCGEGRGERQDWYGRHGNHGNHGNHGGEGWRGEAGPREAQAYPPFNSYTGRDGSLVLEFALAGIDERDVSITFQGDYLVLSAKAPARDGYGDDPSFAARGFSPKNVDRQKYRVSAADYDQEKAKAVFKNGVLSVTVPPAQVQGIKIEIVKEGN